MECVVWCLNSGMHIEVDLHMYLCAETERGALDVKTLSINPIYLIIGIHAGKLAWSKQIYRSGIVRPRGQQPAWHRPRHQPGAASV